METFKIIVFWLCSMALVSMFIFMIYMIMVEVNERHTIKVGSLVTYRTKYMEINARVAAIDGDYFADKARTNYVLSMFRKMTFKEKVSYYLKKIGFK